MAVKEMQKYFHESPSVQNLFEFCKVGPQGETVPPHIVNASKEILVRIGKNLPSDDPFNELLREIFSEYFQGLTDDEKFQVLERYNDVSPLVAALKKAATLTNHHEKFAAIHPHEDEFVSKLSLRDFASWKLRIKHERFGKYVDFATAVNTLACCAGYIYIASGWAKEGQYLRVILSLSVIITQVVPFSVKLFQSKRDRVAEMNKLITKYQPRFYVPSVALLRQWRADVIASLFSQVNRLN